MDISVAFLRCGNGSGSAGDQSDGDNGGDLSGYGGGGCACVRRALLFLDVRTAAKQFLCVGRYSLASGDHMYFYLNVCFSQLAVWVLKILSAQDI